MQRSSTSTGECKGGIFFLSFFPSFFSFFLSIAVQQAARMVALLEYFDPELLWL